MHHVVINIDCPCIWPTHCIFLLHQNWDTLLKGVMLCPLKKTSKAAVLSLDPMKDCQVGSNILSGDTWENLQRILNISLIKYLVMISYGSYLLGIPPLKASHSCSIAINEAILKSLRVKVLSSSILRICW